MTEQEIKDHQAVMDYYERLEKNLNKRQQLDWLINNINDIEIIAIHPNGHTGKPTLLIEISNWDKAKLSQFEIENSCIIFE